MWRIDHRRVVSRLWGVGLESVRVGRAPGKLFEEAERWLVRGREEDLEW